MARAAARAEGVEIVIKTQSIWTKATLAGIAVVVGITSGCAKKKPDPMDSVSGVIVKPDYVKFGPTAVAHVRLADVTRGQAEGQTVVQKSVTPNEDGTIPFTLVFKEKQIDPNHKYAVDARVVDKDHVTVIGGKDHQVLTHGHGDTVEMQLDHGSRF
jgi:putative lipoprotein